MSWKEFERTLDARPKLRAVLPRLTEGLSSLLREHPDAVLDTDVLASQFEMDSETVLDLLICMEKQHLVHARYFWECPNDYGTTKEADHPREFPDYIPCERCGEYHQYNQDFVEVYFIPEPSLREQMTDSRR